MQAIVKVAFPYSATGTHTRMLAVDEILEIRDDLVISLMDAGLIAEASADDLAAVQEGEVVIPPPVEIPATWAEDHWMKNKAIAVALNGGQPVANKAAVTAIIEAELARRAAAEA